MMSSTILTLFQPIFSFCSKSVETIILEIGSETVQCDLVYQVMNVNVDIGRTCKCHEKPVNRSSGKDFFCGVSLKKLDYNDISISALVGDNSFPLHSKTQNAFEQLAKLKCVQKVSCSTVSESLLFGNVICDEYFATKEFCSQ